MGRNGPSERGETWIAPPCSPASKSYRHAHRREPRSTLADRSEDHLRVGQAGPHPAFTDGVSRALLQAADSRVAGRAELRAPSAREERQAPVKALVTFHGGQ